MRLLLDESLPSDLLVGHLLTRLGNGALLRQAEFQAVLTADQNIEFQQNLKTLPIAVVVLVANSNRLESLVPLVAGFFKRSTLSNQGLWCG